MDEEGFERFGVETETGARYTLSLIQEYRLIPSLGGRQRVAGLRGYDVGGCGHANYVDERTFKIVATGETARRIGASA